MTKRHTCRVIHADATYSLPNLAREVDPRADRSQDASCLINRRERVPNHYWDDLLLDGLVAAIRVFSPCNTSNGGSSCSENLTAVCYDDAHETKTRAFFVAPLSYFPCAIPHGQLIPCSSRYEGMRATRIALRFKPPAGEFHRRLKKSLVKACCRVIGVWAREHMQLLRNDLSSGMILESIGYTKFDRIFPP